MLKPGRSVVILVAMVVVIGFLAYWAQKKTPPSSQAPTQAHNTASTNRPYLHSNHSTNADSETAVKTIQPDASNVPREKVEEYLRLHNRNAASLLAAFHALQDTNFLNEAATNFSNDPRVQLTILTSNQFPEDRRKWLDSFKNSSPSNSLANYLSAADFFKNKQPDAAMKEILAASAKPEFKDYNMDTMLDTEELGRFNGNPEMMTHFAALNHLTGDLLPELSNFKSIATNIRDLQQQYLNSGDAASAQNLAQAGLNMANRFTSGDGGKFVINQLVGIATENIVLDSLDKNTAHDFLGGETPAQRLVELKQQKDSITAINRAVLPAYTTMNADQMTGYWDRLKIYGELEAMRWWQQQNITPNSGN